MSVIPFQSPILPRRACLGRLCAAPFCAARTGCSGRAKTRTRATRKNEGASLRAGRGRALARCTRGVSCSQGTQEGTRGAFDRGGLQEDGRRNQPGRKHMATLTAACAFAQSHGAALHGRVAFGFPRAFQPAMAAPDRQVPAPVTVHRPDSCASGGPRDFSALAPPVDELRLPQPGPPAIDDDQRKPAFPGCISGQSPKFPVPGANDGGQCRATPSGQDQASGLGMCRAREGQMKSIMADKTVKARWAAPLVGDQPARSGLRHYR